MAIAIERAHFLAERKKAETLSQRADLASALLASFSHDLRTPVTSVRVAVTNLQDVTLGPEERRAQAQLALQELDRLTRLFQDILDMARIDAAAVNPDRQWVSPADVVDAAVAHVAPATRGTRASDRRGRTDRDPGGSSLDLDCARPRAGERRTVLAERMRRSRYAPGRRAMAHTSSSGITVQGSSHQTWIISSSRSIAAQKHDMPPEQDWGSRSPAGCWRPKAVGFGARTCPMVAHSSRSWSRRPSASSTRRNRSDAITRADRGR